MDRNWLDILTPTWRNAFAVIGVVNSENPVSQSQSINLMSEIKIKLHIFNKNLDTPIEGFVADIHLKSGVTQWDVSGKKNLK